MIYMHVPNPTPTTPTNFSIAQELVFLYPVMGVVGVRVSLGVCEGFIRHGQGFHSASGWCRLWKCFLCDGTLTVYTFIMWLKLHYNSNMQPVQTRYIQMSYSPVCTSFLQQPTLAIYTCFLHSTSSSTVLREIKKKKNSSNVTAGGSQ